MKIILTIITVLCICAASILYFSPKTETETTMSTWKTYTNTFYGFTLKYPRDMFVLGWPLDFEIHQPLPTENGYNNQIFITPSRTISDVDRDYMAIRFAEDVRNDTRSIQQHFKEDARFVTHNVEDIRTINGVDFIFIRTEQGDSIAYFKVNGYILSAEMDKNFPSQELFMEILDTFEVVPKTKQEIDSNVFPKGPPKIDGSI
ncbi:MAG: hypothetical protein RL150_258 [Candidatus Parcubacteria bacterium]|jgi:hypothetical protein